MMKDSRNQQIAFWIEHGKTSKQVASLANISEERVRQIVASYRRKKQYEESEWSGLPPRLCNVLKAAGYDTKDKVVDAMASGELESAALNDEHKIAGFTLDGYAEVFSWLYCSGGVARRQMNKIYKVYDAIIRRVEMQ